MTFQPIVDMAEHTRPCTCCQRVATWQCAPADMRSCACSYGLIKVDLQEAELDVADQYTASVAIGEQVP